MCGDVLIGVGILRLQPARDRLFWQAIRDWRRAEADWDQTIALNPKQAGAYAQRGLLYLRQGKESEAEKDFVQCLVLDKRLMGLS